MPTKYEIITASARSYLTPEIEDFIYGMYVQRHVLVYKHTTGV